MQFFIRSYLDQAFSYRVNDVYIINDASHKIQFKCLKFCYIIISKQTFNKNNGRRKPHDKRQAKLHIYDQGSNYNRISHIVLSLTLDEKQRTAFPRQKLVAHISGGLPLPSADILY